jgi:hypothetical protein
MTKQDEPPPRKARIIKALSSPLKGALAGIGFDEKTIRQAQAVIDHNKFDFAPEALRCFQQLEGALSRARSGEGLEEARDAITEAVMNLKGAGSTFGYPLITRLANSLLGFIEDVPTLDAEVIQIAEAYLQSFKTVLDRGPGGPKAAASLETALGRAIQRYFAKRGRPSGEQR